MIGTEKGGDHIFVQRKSFLRVLLVGSWQGFQEPSKTPSKGASTPCSPMFGIMVQRSNQMQVYLALFDN